MKTGRKIFALLLTMAMLAVSLYTPVVMAAGGPEVPGWTIQGSNGAEFTWAVDTSESNSGGASLWMRNNSGYINNVFGCLETTIAVEKGAEYEYGFVAKANRGGSIAYFIDWGTRYYCSPVGNTFGWTPFSASYKHTSDNPTVTLRFALDGPTKDFWIDDVYFYKVENGKRVGKNLIYNGTFDTDIMAGVSSEDSSNASGLGRTFTIEDAQERMSMLPKIPVYRNDGVVLDGNTDDWNDIPVIHMPVDDTQYYHLSFDPVDITADLKFSYDDKNLYILISVTDDVHYVLDTADDFWKGDCIQYTLSTFDEVYGKEVNVIYDPATNKTSIYTEKSEEQNEDIMAVGSQRGKTTTYEMAIAWDVRFGNRPEECLFSILAHDSDGGVRKNVLQLSPGIVTGKTNAQFPTLMMMEDMDFYAWAETADGLEPTDELPVDICLVNTGEEQTFTITTGAGESTNVSVPARSGLKKTIMYPIENRSGNHNLSFTITSESGHSMELEHTVTIMLTDKIVEDAIAKVKPYPSELELLLKQCEEKGISTDYEIVNYEIIKMFINDMEKDKSDTNYLNTLGSVHIPYVEECLTELYEEAKENLTAYLAGEKEPKSVPKYVISDNPMEIDNQTLWADMEIDGEIERRPAFFGGFGHFEEVREALPLFQKLGFNTTQNEIGPCQYWGWPSAEDWDNGIEVDILVENGRTGEDNMNDYCKMLETAEKNNVAVDVLYASHYFLGPIEERYPEIYGKAGNFIYHNIMHPKAIEWHEKFLRLFCDRIKDYKSVNNFCLANEIQFRCSVFPDFYNNDWVGTDGTMRDGWWSYLKKLYDNDINKLNEHYGTEYESFESVPMSESSSDNPQKLLDFKNFNDPILQEWHQWMADIVHEYMPDLPIHTKLMVTLYNGAQYTTTGENIETFATFSDLNGCDAGAFIDGETMQYQYQWYDFMSSAQERPIVNSEHHIIRDGSTSFDRRIATFNSADVWQGAFHGRGQSQLWLWSKMYDPSDYRGNSAGIRPDVLASLGKTMMDLNRLSYEVTAIETKAPEVLILHSDSTRINNGSKYYDAMHALYTSLIYNGKKVRFMLDDQSDKLNPNDYKLLIVPECTNVTAEVLGKIKEYIEKGGKVLIVGENAFENDESGRPNDEETVRFVREHSATVESIYKCDVDSVVFDALKDANLVDVTVVDAETGEKVKDVEYGTAMYNGKLLVNLLDHKWDTKKVKLLLNGVPVTGLTELRSGDKIADEFELEGYKPVLIQAELDSPFMDTVGHWAESEIGKLAKEEIVKGVSESKFEPESHLTNAEFLTLATRTAGLEGSSYRGSLKDVNSNDWFAETVQGALDAGIIDDVIANGEFHPNDGITRENMAYIAVKTYEWKTEKAAEDNGNTFTDGAAISENKREYVNKAYGLGFVNGNETGAFLPKKTLTRAEGAMVIYNMLNRLDS